MGFLRRFLFSGVGVMDLCCFDEHEFYKELLAECVFIMHISFLGDGKQLIKKRGRHGSCFFAVCIVEVSRYIKG